MKSRLFLLFLALCFIQCGDFLEEQSQSEVRPSTVSDMEKILESGAYPTQAAGRLFNRETEIFTDNVQSTIVDVGLVTRKESESWRFRWDEAMFHEDGGGSDITFWSTPYERIKGCNIVLEYTDEMDGSDVKKAHIKGEAYVLRGLYYYMLVNFFGAPYNGGDPTTNLGVPLKLVTGVTDEKFKRNTVAECYDQILKDILLGTQLMKENHERQSNDILRLRYPTGYALLSRVYLHMNDWDKVISYADSVLDIQPQLLDLKSAYNASGSGVYHGNTRTEILWAMAETDGTTKDRDVIAPFIPSSDLLDLYLLYDVDGTTDGRMDDKGIGWFKWSSWDNPRVYRCVLKGYAAQYWINAGIRTAEVYLNRAEAYIRKYMKSGNEAEARLALEDLNELRRHRLSAEYVDVAMDKFANAEELLEFCLRERRRELCYEGNHRWFDLRRLGMPELTHVFLDNDNGYETTYTLRKNDGRYVLPIPGEVLLRNPNLANGVDNSTHNE